MAPEPVTLDFEYCTAPVGLSWPNPSCGAAPGSASEAPMEEGCPVRADRQGPGVLAGGKGAGRRDFAPSDPGRLWGPNPPCGAVPGSISEAPGA